MVMTRKRSRELALLESEQSKKQGVSWQQPPALRRHKRRRISCPKASEDQLYNRDIWSCIASFLDACDLARLALTSRFFVEFAMDDRLWRSLCLKRLDIGDSMAYKPDFTWKSLYKAAFDGTHSYSVDEYKHLFWMRIGAFPMLSGKAVVFGRLWQRVRKDMTTEEFFKRSPCFIVDDVKPGIWIADLHLLDCPICDNPKCEGTMQTLEFRNWELFLHEDYRNGKWSYTRHEAHNLEECDAATGGVFDYYHLVQMPKKSGIGNFKSWIGPVNDFAPHVAISGFGACACTHIKEKDSGLRVKFYIMTAGEDGPVVAIRISHRLL